MTGFIPRALRCLAAAAALTAAQYAHAAELPALGTDLARTSVSGLSSGAYMAGQFQVAYSDIVTGAGIVAGGPFACAHTPGSEFNPSWPAVVTWNLARALNQCMSDRGWFWFFSAIPSATGLVSRAEALARAGKIAPLEGLAADRVYLFSGGRDKTVVRGVVETAETFYRKAGIPAANIAFVKHPKAAHAFVTEEGGLACGTRGEPFINDCDYDQAGAILTQIYGALQPPGTAVEANYVPFEQTPYAAGPGNAGLAAEGVAYVPESCRTQGGCAVHIVFHGCRQGRPVAGDAVVKGAGFARWAETNRIVVLFPQVQADGTSGTNPKGCWDWWGYTGPDFLTREAPQMRAVRRMLDRLAAR
jgi:hypothetical protein